jgi:predicted small integral membrane protein
MAKRLSKKNRRLDLFGRYYAEATEEGTFFVRENGLLKSPHEYSALDMLTNYCYVFYRAWEPKVDILFPDLSWFLGAVDVYEVAHFGGPNGISILAAVTEEGTRFFTDEGRELAFIPGFPRITIFDDRFLVVYDPEPPGPYVKVYNFLGDLVSEGLLWEAQSKALDWKP